MEVTSLQSVGGSVRDAMNDFGWPVLLTLILFVFIKWPRLRPYQRMAGTEASTKARLAVLAFVALTLLIIWTDWPGALNDQFWRDHALLSGTVTSVLLLGAGLLLFDAESHRRRAARQHEINKEMHRSLRAALQSLNYSSLTLLDESLPRDRRVPYLDLARGDLRAYVDHVNHWALVSLILDADDLTVAHILTRLRSKASRIADFFPERPLGVEAGDFMLIFNGERASWKQHLTELEDIHGELNKATIEGDATPAPTMRRTLRHAKTPEG